MLSAREITSLLSSHLERLSEATGVDLAEIRLGLHRDEAGLHHSSARITEPVHDRLMLFLPLDQIEQLPLCTTCDWSDTTVLWRPAQLENIPRREQLRYGSFSALGAVGLLASLHSRLDSLTTFAQLEQLTGDVTTELSPHAVLTTARHEIEQRIAARLTGELLAAFEARLRSELLEAAIPAPFPAELSILHPQTLAAVHAARARLEEELARPGWALLELGPMMLLTDPLVRIHVRHAALGPHAHLLSLTVLAWLRTRGALVEDGSVPLSERPSPAVLETIAALYDPASDGAFSTLAGTLEIARAL